MSCNVIVCFCDISFETGIVVNECPASPYLISENTGASVLNVMVAECVVISLTIKLVI